MLLFAVLFIVPKLVYSISVFTQRLYLNPFVNKNGTLEFSQYLCGGG